MSVDYESDFADPGFTHSAYRRLLGAALDGGYAFVDFPAATGSSAANEPTLRCVLRHDCDNDLLAAHALAGIEAELGVRSTYFIFLRSPFYNPFSLPNRRLIDRILGMGHWLGLHFDEQAYPGHDDAAMADRIDAERDWMVREFGVPIDVVSFHQPTVRVLENRIRPRCINIYDKSDMAGIFYISDSNKFWKNQDLAGLFRERTHPCLQVLVHPEWWTPQPVSVIENWQTVFRHQFELAQAQALEREHSYNRRHAAAFASMPVSGE